MFISCTIMIFLACILVNAVESHIVRLPCAQTGHFTKADDSKSTGTLISTIENKSKRQCALECIFKLGYKAVNSKKDGSVCELLSNTPAINSDAEWITMATENKDFNKRGPLCEKSDCPTKCREACDENNKHVFVCLEYSNVALRGEASQAHTSSSGNIANFAFDGDMTTFTHTAFGKPFTWIKLKLDYVYFINTMKIFPKDSNKGYRVAGYDILCSLYNIDFVNKGITLPTYPYSEYEINMPMRYLKLLKNPASYSIFDALEIKVFV